MNEYFPPRVKSIHQSTKSWITTGIRISCRNKKILYTDMRAGFVTRDYYSQYSLILRNVIKTAKQLYYKRKLQSSNNKSKTMWKLIKTTHNKTNTKLNIKKLSENGESITETLNRANDYFIDACNFAHPENQIEINLDRHANSFFLVPCVPYEVEEIIRNSKNSFAVGYDEIPTCLLKCSSKVISAPLAYIINLCLENGYFPEQLKNSDVKLLFKKGDKSNLENYRPIALLPTLSKILEKILFIRLTCFLSKFRIFSDSQNAFIKGRNTERAVFQMVQEITGSVNKSRSTGALFLDLSKAFDSLEHEVLYHKLEAVGIRGLPQKLIVSYIANRRQRVVCGDELGSTITSNWRLVKRGVPQGSILGPLLFTLYIN